MRFTSISGLFSSVRARMVATLLLCCAVMALAGCGGSAASGQQSMPTPVGAPTVAATPTPPAKPKVVFQANWSHGAGAWRLPPHWSIQGGALVTDGQATENAPVPYTVSAPNYRIMMTARVVDVTYKNTSCNNFFGIAAQDSSSARMFTAESACFGPLPYHGDSRLIGADGSGPVWELIIGSNARSYRVDVYGSRAIYFPGGAGSIGGITNAQPNAPAHLSIEASQVKLVITSFVIMMI